jgi:hypothetical protein
MFDCMREAQVSNGVFTVAHSLLLQLLVALVLPTIRI